MSWFILLVLTSALYANSFDLKETGNRFSLMINSRHLKYTSEKKNVALDIKKCNLPVVRALNAELLSQVPKKDFPKGLPFLVDGNTYYIAANGDEAKVLLSMDQRMVRFEMEEKKACTN